MCLRRVAKRHKPSGKWPDNAVQKEDWERRQVNTHVVIFITALAFIQWLGLKYHRKNTFMLVSKSLKMKKTWFNFFGERYVNTALGLCVAMESCIKQNNAIEIYEVIIFKFWLPELVFTVYPITLFNKRGVSNLLHWFSIPIFNAFFKEYFCIRESIFKNYFDEGFNFQLLHSWNIKFSRITLMTY